MTPEETLVDVTARLTRLGVSHALVGGLAISIRAEVRFTRDVDLAIAVDSDAAVARITRALATEGFALVAVVEQDEKQRIAIARLRSPSGIVVDLLAASSGIEREIVEAARVAGAGRPTSCRSALGRHFGGAFARREFERLIADLHRVTREIYEQGRRSGGGEILAGSWRERGLNFREIVGVRAPELHGLVSLLKARSAPQASGSAGPVQGRSPGRGGGRLSIMPRETAAARLRLAMAMQREGGVMMRRNLRRKHPSLSEAEIDVLFDTWLLSRDVDAPGRPVPWPRRPRTPRAPPTR